MQLLRTLLGCALLGNATATLLVDFNAAVGDDPSVLGLLNLEEARGVRPKANEDDLYFKKGKDWKKNPAAHIYRKDGFIRAEYHSLNQKTVAGETYYIGYKLALQKLVTDMVIFQWKEYVANTPEGGGAGIPLSLRWHGGKLELSHQDNQADKGAAVWSGEIADHTVYSIGIEIFADAKKGTARLWLNGKPQTMTGGPGAGTTTAPGNMFPGRSDPKFGAYGGVGNITTWIYNVQIGTKKSDLDSSYFSH